MLLGTFFGVFLKDNVRSFLYVCENGNLNKKSYKIMILASVLDITTNVEYVITKTIFVAPQSTSGLSRLILEVSGSHTIRHTHTHTHGRTPLNECSVSRRDRYLHNKHNRRISMSSAEFERAIPATEWPPLRPHGHRYGKINTLNAKKRCKILPNEEKDPLGQNYYGN